MADRSAGHVIGDDCACARENKSKLVKKLCSDPATTSKQLQPTVTNPNRKRQFPSGLADACEQFQGKLLIVRLAAGWGWNRFVNGVHESIEPRENPATGDLAVRANRFFGDKNILRGFVGRVETRGHGLHKTVAILFTLSAGLDYDFQNNICMAWGASFGDREPPDIPGMIPEFSSGKGFTGYATAFENESYLRECQERLNRIDPRKRDR